MDSLQIEMAEGINCWVRKASAIASSTANLLVIVAMVCIVAAQIREFASLHLHYKITFLL